MRLFVLTLFLCIFASCAGSKAQGKSLHQILTETSCPNFDDFRGIGIGSNESEALAQARSNMALEHFSSEIKSDIHISGQNINQIATSKTRTNITQESTLMNPQDAKLHHVAVQNKNVGVVACMARADAAKSYKQMQNLLQDSIEFVASVGIKTTHPKEKNEARSKANSLWIKILANQDLLKSWGIDSDISKAKEIRAALEDNCKDFCLNQKIHWKAERESLYSDIAFAKLSQNLKIEKTNCAGNDILLVYKDEKPECKKEHGMVYVCPYKASLSIKSCRENEYLQLKSENLEGVNVSMEYALEHLREKLDVANFWREWEDELKKWRLKCE